MDQKNSKLAEIDDARRMQLLNRRDHRLRHFHVGRGWNDRKLELGAARLKEYARLRRDHWAVILYTPEDRTDGLPQRALATACET